MTTKEFIEKAIKGGWEYRGIKEDNFLKVEDGSLDEDIFLFSKYNHYLIPISRILLNPKAWEAVGKVEGWNEESKLSSFRLAGWNSTYRAKMHQMIDALIEGKTIEDYLSTL